MMKFDYTDVYVLDILMHTIYPSLQGSGVGLKLGRVQHGFNKLNSTHITNH